MPIPQEELREIVRALASRPRHEKVRTYVHDLLVRELNVTSAEVDFERPVPEVRGRLDALLGRTVFEFKSNLRTELRDVQARLPDYLTDRERETGQSFIGIATDGADFIPYEIRRGALVRLPSYRTDPDRPRDLLAWLDGILVLNPSLAPGPEAVQRELGRGSVAFAVARSTLEELWNEVKDNPDIRLKRELWASLLALVYGTRVESDQLFFQHTYLTIVAKTMAVQVLNTGVPDPVALLSGRPFEAAGISGAVESDFFDWVLAVPGGHDLVQKLARQVLRFDLREVQQDVLKVLYESLIDPEQRHDLGEYYTPDWLAAKICSRAIERPLEQRVLDPACGSGTFLFHAVRRYLDAAEQAGHTNQEALHGCCSHVLGIDVHPVAAIIARVTYLLALGEERLRNRPRQGLSLPVYLGDSLQWNTEGFMADREVLVEVPDGPLLHFPFAVTRDPTVFDAVLDQVLRYTADSDDNAAGLLNWLQRNHVGDEEDHRVLIQTCLAIRGLIAEGRNHIWGYVTRNLSRPIWISTPEQRADVVVGNPPWLSYRYMSASMQRRFARDSWQRGLWAGGKVATHQDLSGLFYALSGELYLKPGGLIAFVMPYAAMSRLQFRGFRTGSFGGRATDAMPAVLRDGDVPPPRRRPGEARRVFATVRFTDAWALDEHVQPLFPVPSCVLFARTNETGPLPKAVQAAAGRLASRNASSAEAERALQWEERPWPSESDITHASTYRNTFHQGATMVPRSLLVVEHTAPGRFGSDQAAPTVRSRHSGQEKPPWKDIVMDGPVEADFLRPLYLGESIAPFRLLQPALAVVPWDPASKTLLDAASAQRAGLPHLASWMHEAEGHWSTQGRSPMTLLERWDYHGSLALQFPPAPLRVVYAASGTLPAAALLADDAAVIEHKLYWAAPASPEEARYLEAVLNSETARAGAAHLQSRGQWGARDFDKVIFELPIPSFNAADPLHQALERTAARAEKVAADVPLHEKEYFVRTRGRIREALREDGVAQEIDHLVQELLRANV